jgi:signal peptidase I
MAESLARTGHVRVRVYGASMRPAIHSGDVVHIRTCSPSSVRIGDIVACIRNAGLVVHRVVWKSRTRVWLKGDTLPGPDPPMPHGLIFGRVHRVETERGAMNLSTRAARRTNRFLLLYMFPLSLALAAGRALRGPRAEPFDSQRPLSRARRAAEWLPRKLANRLISKNR